MRRVLIDQARRKQSQKHGGSFQRQDLLPDHLPVHSQFDPIELVAVHEGLDALAEKSERKAELVKLRFFVGLGIPEAADILGRSWCSRTPSWPTG